MTLSVGAKPLDLGVAAGEASPLHGMFQLGWCLGCLCVCFHGKGPAHWKICQKMIHNIIAEGRVVVFYLMYI